MKFLTDPALFNYIIMTLYLMSAGRWAYEGKYALWCSCELQKRTRDLLASVQLTGPTILHPAEEGVFIKAARKQLMSELVQPDPINETSSQHIYLIGSLRNPKVPIIANELRAKGFEVFDDWFAAGPEADDWWMKYEQVKGHNFTDALHGYAAHHVFDFDITHLKRASHVVLILPAGKSGHLELGWGMGQGKKGYILYDKEPERFDVMYRFADGVFTELDDLIAALKE